jgi:hypothetical protein
MKFGVIINNQDYEKKIVFDELYCVDFVRFIFKRTVKL